MVELPRFPLKDGNTIPAIGFGCGTPWFKKPGETRFDTELVAIVKKALALGFVHLDCAEMYGNEEEIGVAIQESGIPRDKLFITSKVAKGINDIPGALSRSLKNLNLDYVDLYLIHEPFFAKSDEDFQRAWKEMQGVKQAGKAKSIGVSNFLRADLEATIKTATDPPVVNQLEYHPYLQRSNEYVPWMQQQQIQIESFKSLTPLAYNKKGPLSEYLETVAKAHNTSPTAILLSWNLQQRIVAVTTTRKEERLLEWAQALDIKLTPDEMEQIKAIGLTYHSRHYLPHKFSDNDRS